uniref:ABC-2 type transporter n=1 Tax=Riquetophycus sp. TaxID=1897556 RepID=A0A1C9C8E7_9FLOR|nr:ABC-2 type transporter [Riquetophycus sp.]
MLKTKNQIIQMNPISCTYHEIQALIKRLYIQTRRRPSSIISGIIQPLLWLILFSALFQNAPVGLFKENMKYGNFLSPGIIIFTTFTGSINAGLPLMFDREFGFLNRLLISPLTSRDSLFIASIFFITLITLLQTITIILFTIIKFHNITKLHEVIYILLVTLLISLSISSISICLAFILPGHIEFLAFILVINLPMLFSSTALAPLYFMPYWLQMIASLNPLTYAIEMIRFIIMQTNSNVITINTAWFHLGFHKNFLFLTLFNILSFTITKSIISYKFE